MGPQWQVPLVHLGPRELCPWNHLVLNVRDSRIVDDAAGAEGKTMQPEEVEGSDVLPVKQGRQECHESRADHPEDPEDIGTTFVRVRRIGIDVDLWFRRDVCHLRSLQ